MKLWRKPLFAALFCLVAPAALATGPTASPEGVLTKTPSEIVSPSIKAFGDPGDFKAAALAGAAHLRGMQADVTEDNAGNGDPDLDPEDGGWDWSTFIFEHSATTSAGNLYGVTGNGILQVFKFNSDPALLTALFDAADMMVTRGPASVRSGADILFLLEFADLPEVTDKAYYRNAAVAIWEYRLANNTTTGSATEFAEYLRDYRAASYPNGIIPWDIAPWAEALMKLDAAFPGMGYDVQGVQIAEVLYQDSFVNPEGYFKPHGANKGADPDFADVRFWWYTGGVSGLIRAFLSTGTHLTMIAGLWNELLDCQYEDGAFSNQFGASPDFDDRDYQMSAYSLMAIHDNLPFAGANVDMFQRGVTWISSVQDASGGFLFSDLSHYPEVSGECITTLAYGWTTMGAAITTAPVSAVLGCGDLQDITFGFDRNEGTVGVRGYEITLQVNGPVDSFGVGAFSDAGSLAGLGDHYFRAIDNGNGTFTVTDAVLGVTDGLLVDAPLFTLTLTGNTDGQVDIEILDYKLRDPNNVPVFADVFGSSYLVDCTAPEAVSGITTEPHHNRVAVSWAHDGTETAVYEVYRGVWYDNDNGGVSAYPEYDDLPGEMIPTRPSSRAVAAASGEWELAGSTVVGTNAFDDIFADATTRGVYYYEVFAVDAADNGSLAAEANDRATNYWLGDVAGELDVDGFVDVLYDISALGSSFATTPLDLDYNPACDVGPTDDWSRTGIPETDNVIDFEDLMVFSMNFAVVNDIDKSGPVTASFAQLAWIRLDEGQYALRLVSGTGLKGFHVLAQLPGGMSAVVSGGSLLSDQDGEIFFRNVGSALDVNVAMMGGGGTFVGHGDLFVVATTAEIVWTDLNITLRDADNAAIEFTLDSTSGVAIPTAFQLRANYPNPFNPMTKISFSLPEAQSVKLSVYSLDGRKVATLLDEPRGPGQHDVLWMGRNDAGQGVASGTYFYRLDAGPYSQVRKMTLMK